MVNNWVTVNITPAVGWQAVFYSDLNGSLIFEPTAFFAFQNRPATAFTDDEGSVERFVGIGPQMFGTYIQNDDDTFLGFIHDSQMNSKTVHADFVSEGRACWKEDQRVKSVPPQTGGQGKSKNQGGGGHGGHSGPSQPKAIPGQVAQRGGNRASNGRPGGN